jgi:muconate cycloisomerase
MQHLAEKQRVSGPVISGVRTEILDLPITRPHRFAHQTMHHQSHLLVRITTEDGLEGIGEGVTAGGPWWGGESVETMKATIDNYLAAALVGKDAGSIELLLQEMDRVAAANPFAKAAVEMACYDLLGRYAGLPLYRLLGGLYRESIPVLWAVGAGGADENISEMENKLGAGLHSRFKVKVGAADPEADAQRIKRISAALGEDARLVIDPNSSWDLPTAMRMIPELAEAGVSLLEQPLPRWDIGGMAKLADMQLVPLMGDEGVCSPHDALAFAERRAAHVFSLKVHKTGGLSRSKKVAAIAEAAGIRCFGGTNLETSVGTAAALHLYCALANLSEDCELFGPLLLADDIVEEPIGYRDFRAWLPHGPGLGVSLDEEKVEHYRRRS